jgi:hypothetical protein
MELSLEERLELNNPYQELKDQVIIEEIPDEEYYLACEEIYEAMKIHDQFDTVISYRDCVRVRERVSEKMDEQLVFALKEYEIY